MTFPTEWPDGCPPDAAGSAGGTVFRLVKANPCCDSDFLSHLEVGKMPDAPACLRCGLSVFGDDSDAAHMARKYPKIGHLIARGELSEAHGRAMLTTGQRPTHTTWWPYAEVIRKDLFEVVREA